MPGSSGAIISTEMSALLPGDVSGTATLAGAPICSPLIKAHSVPAGHGAQPVEAMRQVLVNLVPGSNSVPSSTFTSFTKTASGKQGVDVGVLVDVGVDVGI